MSHVDTSLNAVSLCAGYGGLDEGFHAACQHLGFAARTVAYVEWEAYAAALLLTRMEDQALAPAPIWCGDLGRLDGHDFRGRVDAVLAGFPCQPHSMAGSRKGIEDERWIWPAIARFIRDSGAWVVVLENVAGLLSSGGLAPVLADLASMGFRVEWGVLSAASVGASHRRERVFIVAVRMGNAAGHSKSTFGAVPQRESSKLDGEHIYMAHAESQRLGESGRHSERPEERPGGSGDELADASKPGREGCELGTALHGNRGGAEAHGPTSEFRGPFFAPGPDDDRWPDILAEHPFLAPALEPGVRVLVDGHAVVVGKSRPNQLRAAGNGVVALQAATAIVCLMRRLGIGA